jgi:CysZ protein
MFKQFPEAVKAYGAAVNLIISQKLWAYFLYPVLIFVLLLVGGTVLIDQLSEFLKEELLSLFHMEPAAPGSGLTSGILSFIVGIALRIIFFIAYAIVLKYLILILLSPILALLSEKTEEIMTGKKYAFSLSRFLKDIIRGILLSIVNMLIQLGLLLCCLLLMTIPILGWLSPFFLVIINYYFYGFTMIDYTSERYGLTVSQSIYFVRRNKGLAIGNGFIFAVLFAIPFLGVIVAPVLSVVAATIVSVKAHQSNTFIHYAKN